MKLIHQIVDHTCVVTIIGNLALTETESLEKYLSPLIKNSDINKIVLNCKNVEIIDSRGVGLLAAVLKDLEDLNKELMLCHLNRAVLGILQSLQLDKIIPIRATESEALSNG